MDELRRRCAALRRYNNFLKHLSDVELTREQICKVIQQANSDQLYLDAPMLFYLYFESEDYRSAGMSMATRENGTFRFDILSPTANVSYESRPRSEYEYVLEGMERLTISTPPPVDQINGHYPHN